MINKKYERLGITNVKWTTRWIINAKENDSWNNKYLSIKSTELKSKCYREAAWGNIIQLIIKIQKRQELKQFKGGRIKFRMYKRRQGGLADKIKSQMGQFDKNTLCI